MPKYEWLPTECCPEKFPMQILWGTFVCDDGEQVNIPDGKFLFNGWGKLGSTHIIGDDLKSIPHQLSITWFSFTENKFYAGDFILPHDKIDSMFEQGFISPINNVKKTYKKIVIGLAPKGGIAIWLMGERITKEVCFLNASDTNFEWSQFINNPDYTREKYIKLKLAQIFDSIDFINLKNKGIPIDLWSNTYRKRYVWSPKIISKANNKSIIINYYNGESDFIDFSPGDDLKKESRTVPSMLGIKWTKSTSEKYGAEVVFNEEEIFAAFDRLNSLDQSKLTMQIEINDVSNSLDIYLVNGKSIYQLRKISIRLYRD